eukprot:Sdes_comp18625_c0_seq1m8810
MIKAADFPILFIALDLSNTCPTSSAISFNSPSLMPHPIRSEPQQDSSSSSSKPEFAPDAHEKGTPEDESTRLGCRHYQRACVLEAACCGSNSFVSCRFCHDESVSTHSFDRYQVKYVKCLRCGEIQPASSRCISEKCQGTPFARYFCHICKLYDDTPEKSIFHCDECGLCRVGDKSQYKHCKRCCACISSANWSSHKCVENALKDQCPVCFEDMFQSILEVIFLRCGHACHKLCLEELVKHDYRCPVCLKSISQDTSFINNTIDSYLRKSSMPPQYS